MKPTEHRFFPNLQKRQWLKWASSLGVATLLPWQATALARMMRPAMSDTTLATALPLGLESPPAADIQAMQGKIFDVIVIGAGIAGLAAARELRRHHKNVLLLEAQNRLGGRTYTSSAWQDAPMDLGASWIHGVVGNPITQLAQQFNAQRVTTSYERAKLMIAPALKAAGVDELDEIRYQSLIEQALAHAEQSDADISLREAVQTYLAHSPPLSPEAEAQLEFILSSQYEQEYAGAAEQLSALSLDDNEQFAGEDALFPQGYRQIVAGLAQNIPYLLEQPVTHIHYHRKNDASDDVQVTTTGGQFTAKKVVVTVPLGVLKRNIIQFSPALPMDKREAINRLGMGLLNKHYLRFDRVFWDKKIDWFEFLAHDKGSAGKWSEWVSFAKLGDLPVLLGFSAAKYAHELEQKSDAAIVAEAMEVLRQMFGADIPNPIAYQITRWGQNPYAFGSYSFNAVGSGNQDRAALTAAVANKLYFAGEACSQSYWGTVHGAYVSGLATAKAVLEPTTPAT